ncbi:hypothetical protein IMSHALPRED_011143 [Imshaugia aleurites]|uniref:Uncharacterized protein n=1 Tax=Imshaugia aleurites TaxID=172621 RepID=A0A8H3G644_9LECA|nr:hypothetical protein IMSHALPRED_011143 [Imshaugia aleurites]
MQTTVHPESTPQGRKFSVCWFVFAQWQNDKPGRLALSDLRNPGGKLLPRNNREAATCAAALAYDPQTLSTLHPIDQNSAVSWSKSHNPRNVTWNWQAADSHPQVPESSRKPSPLSSHVL